VLGKSTAVRMAVSQEGRRLVEINLERHQELDRVFKTLNTGRILAALESAAETSLGGPDGVLFLDEIQATPNALAALRYLYEEHPELPVVAAGSLLEFTLTEHEMSMPVGRVEYHWMYPLTFHEFLRARGKSFLAEKVAKFSPGDHWPQPQHGALLEEMRWYMIVGGMPEALQVFIDGGREADVRRVHDNIIATYSDDFSKYATRRELARLQHVYRRLPQLCGKKVKYSEVIPHEKSADVRSVIDLMTKAGIIHPVYHATCDGIPLRAGIDYRIFKTYWLDSGLLARMQGLTWEVWNREDTNRCEGVLAEQFVAQELVAAQRSADPSPLCYWLREGKTSNCEVDFVVQRDTDLLPIEVKSGSSGSLKSLALFAQSRKAATAVKLSANAPSQHHVSIKLALGQTVTEVNYELDERPLYLAGSLL
jgi:predicted AAA+ superfamily ATPase